MGRYVVTGASRGIGREVCARLAAHDLLVIGRDAAALARVREVAPRATPLAVDLAEPAGLAAALGTVPPEVDGVVHAAGLLQTGRVADLSPADWATQFAVNVTAVAELTRLLLPALRAARGTVVIVNSNAGQVVSRQGGACYAASKHALVALAAGLRMEEPEVRVSTVYPGRTATDMQRQIVAFEGGEYDAAAYSAPGTVADVIVAALLMPADSVLTDVHVRPRSG